jgi:hypothetical protein
MSSDLIEASREVRALVEEAPVVMPSVRKSRHRWAVMLAGGDGTRLQSVTLKIVRATRGQSSFFPSSVERAFSPDTGAPRIALSC